MRLAWLLPKRLPVCVGDLLNRIPAKYRLVSNIGSALPSHWTWHYWEGLLQAISADDRYSTYIEFHSEEVRMQVLKRFFGCSETQKPLVYRSPGCRARVLEKPEYIIVKLGNRKKHAAKWASHTDKEHYG